MSIEQQIIQINEYDLVDTPDAFSAAIKAVARRTETAGHPGVEGYFFYVDANARTGGATIIYENAEAWLAHHRIAYQWEEMPALQATVKLKRLTLFGPFNDELRDWLTNANISYTHYDTLAAGFTRR
jgi:hypothetical protein